MNPLSQETIDRFRKIVGQRLGLHFDDDKREFLGGVLQRRIEAVSEGDPRSYLQLLNIESSAGTEVIALAEELTVGETHFFRHPDQFRAFTEFALLPRLRSPATNPRLRILSAGCASGEEAYSSAILVLQHVVDVSRLNASIVGIDINAASIAKACLARYSAWSLRGVPEEIRRSFFRGEKVFALDDTLRSLVSFENRNLMDDTDGFWQPQRFDVIFCRNVLMYFTPEAARTIVERLTRSLAYGGFLFLGPAETLRGISTDYHLKNTHETFYYQRRFPDEKPIVPVLDRPRGSPLFDAFLPPFVEPDASWVGAINQASERIARLSRQTSAGTNLPTDSQIGVRGKSTPRRDSTRPDIQAAREMLQQERFVEALEILELLSTNEREAPDARLLRAVILTNRGEVAEAERLCEQVIAGTKLKAEAHYLLALCQEHRAGHDAAMEHDQIAIQLDRRFAMPHLHLGLLCKRFGDFQGARQAFQQAQLLLPHEDSARILLFGGGFRHELLVNLCQAEFLACGGTT